MKRFSILLLLFATLSCSVAQEATAKIAIVPKPLSIKETGGSFTLVSGGTIAVKGSDALSDLQRCAAMFAAQLKETDGIALETSADGGKSAVILSLDKSLGHEAYTLAVGTKGISVSGGDPAGVFYGLQTLRQLVSEGKVPCVEVKDAPAFAYRGGMLDVARHFFPVEDVKKFIDIIAMHKMNRFHWHLSDDQGWRIEIKKYPDLAKKGSVRKQTLVGRQTKDKMVFDGKPYGGWYTQEQIKEIVAYAKDRFIEVIPEIDMPGHSLAPLSIRPDLGCTGGPYELWCRWGISEDVYCPGKEATFAFIQDILSEIIELFPSPLIHIGGDECPKTRWKKCPDCQRRIKAEGLRNEGELQSYFMNRLADWLGQRGRTIIGWDEVIDAGIRKDATIMVWRDQLKALYAVQAGHNVIMAPKWNCYLDYSQTSDPYSEPLCQTRYLPIRQVYRLDPYDKLKPSQYNQITGVQANLWTEYIPDIKQAEHMLMPRLAAIAETAWSFDRKDLYDDFAERARTVLPQLYSKAGYNYATYFFDGIE